MNDKRLRKHFEIWHPEYDDTGRAVSVDDYRRLVHNEDHEAEGFTNHIHLWGLTIPRSDPNAR